MSKRSADGRRSCDVWLWATVALIGLGSWAERVQAGGTEFPADGARSAGRGGTGMARADDPTVMLRNPALLADLWDHQALLSAHLGIADACFTPTGSAFWQAGDEVYDLGEGPIVASDLYNEPLARMCYAGPAPFFPSAAITGKLSPRVGVGLGFFPPELATLSQWGRRDGTYETPNGLRLNPLRYLGSHLNTTYFSLLGALGYRPLSWLRIGFGFQWAFAIADTTTFATSTNDRRAAGDVRVDLETRDLFIPGFVGSVHLVPIDALDIALGFKWSDRVRADATLNLTSAPFGVRDFLLKGRGGATRTIPTTARDQLGEVDAPPIWMPQLSASVRYAQRLRPRVVQDVAGEAASGGVVEDAMASELFDVELTAIYYFASALDESVFYSDPSTALAQFRELSEDGSVAPSEAALGNCIAPVENGGCRRTANAVPFGGKDQWSLRVGGDYNVLPGVLSLRIGASYESDGEVRDYLNPRYYAFQRIGLHAGLTWRIAGVTDVHFAFSHFIQDDVRVQVHEDASLPGNVRLRPEEKSAEYNYEEGAHDGTAEIPIVYSKATTAGPNFANAGSFFYHLDVFSLAVTQHF